MKALSIVVMVIAGLLLFSSLMGFIIEVNGVPLIGKIRLFAGLLLIALSACLAILSLVSKKHPFYEYWFVVVAGGVVGAIYVTP